MANNKNYTTSIVVLVAILALLLGLILGGVFSIVKESSKSGFVDAGVSDATYGYHFPESPALLSEIDYHTCDNSVPGGIDPRIVPDEDPSPNPTE